MATKRISSHLILHRYVFDKKSNISTIHDVLMIASQIFHKLIIHNFYKKEEYQHLHGRCENMWLILKRNNKCQCPIWTSCRWRFAHFELAPDSTIDQRNLISSTVLEYTWTAWKSRVASTVSLKENRHLLKLDEPFNHVIERWKWLCYAMQKF